MDLLITKDRIDESLDWDQPKAINDLIPAADTIDTLFAVQKQLRPLAEHRGYTLRVDKLRKRLYARSMTSKYRAVTEDQFLAALMKVAAAEAVRASNAF